MNVSHISGKPVLSVSSAGGPVGVSSLTHLQSIMRNLHGVNSPGGFLSERDRKALMRRVFH